MAYIGQAPTKVPLTSADIADGTIALADMAVNSIDSDQYVDGSIDTAHIATNQIDETLIKDAFVGDFSDVTVTAADAFLYGDATDSGNTKKDTVQGILDLAAGGGAWNLIGTSVASTSASLIVTGLDSTYDTYAISWTDLTPVTDNQNLSIQFGDSGGLDSGAGEYNWHRSACQEDSASYAAGASEADTDAQISNAVGNGAVEGCGGMVWLTRPGDASMWPTFSGTFTGIHGTGPLVNGGHVFGSRSGRIAVDRVGVLFGSGDILRGRLTVWGIAHA